MSYLLNDVITERKTKTIYRDKDKVIKLFVRNYSKANILNEALNQARVEEGTDLKIPRLTEVTMIDGRWALVIEHISGKTLAELMEEESENEDKYLNIFVDLQLKVLSKKVPLLGRIKEKFKRKLNEATNISESTKFELLQRLEGMKNYNKLCHGDFNPSNIILNESGDYYIIDWAHATQGNAAADAARTFLLFSMNGKEKLAEKYMNLFSKKSEIDRREIQNWIPIVAATQLTKGQKDEEEFLKKWVNIIDFQ